MQHQLHNGMRSDHGRSDTLRSMSAAHSMHLRRACAAQPRARAQGTDWPNSLRRSLRTQWHSARSRRSPDWLHFAAPRMSAHDPCARTARACARTPSLDHTFSYRTGVIPDSAQFRGILGGSLGLGAILADLRLDLGDFRVRKWGQTSLFRSATWKDVLQIGFSWKAQIRSPCNGRFGVCLVVVRCDHIQALNTPAQTPTYDTTPNSHFLIENFVSATCEFMPWGVHEHPQNKKNECCFVFCSPDQTFLACPA